MPFRGLDTVEIEVRKDNKTIAFHTFWPSFSVAVYLLIIHIEKNNDNLHSYSAKTDFIRFLKRFTKFVIETKI